MTLGEDSRRAEREIVNGANTVREFLFREGFPLSNERFLLRDWEGL